MTLHQSRLDCERAAMETRGGGGEEKCRDTGGTLRGDSLKIILALTIFENVNMKSISLYSTRVSELCRISY